MMLELNDNFVLRKHVNKMKFDYLIFGGIFSILAVNGVRYFRGRVSYFDQSEARKHRFLASDWSKYETLLRKYRTL